MATVGVRGTKRTDSASMIRRFQIPSEEIRMIQKKPAPGWFADWMFECKLRVDPAPEYPDIVSGDWMCKITTAFFWSRDTKTVSVGNINTEPLPPDNVSGPQIGNLLHFIVTGQSFSDKGSVQWHPDPQAGLAGTWRSQSDGIKNKTLGQSVGNGENADILTNGSAWTYILPPGGSLEVELIIPVPPKHAVEEPSLPIRTWTGYTSKLHTDCIMISRDGQEFPAHRFILANGSSVFVAMFEHDMQEKRSGVYKIDDTDGDVLEILLEYLYTDRTDPERIKDVVEAVFDAADKYAVAGLRAACENIMANSLSAKTAIPYLNFAVARGLGKLQMRTIQFLYDHATESTLAPDDKQPTSRVVVNGGAGKVGRELDGNPAEQTPAARHDGSGDADRGSRSERLATANTQVSTGSSASDGRNILPRSTAMSGQPVGSDEPASTGLPSPTEFMERMSASYFARLNGSRSQLARKPPVSALVHGQGQA